MERWIASAALLGTALWWGADAGQDSSGWSVELLGVQAPRCIGQAQVELRVQGPPSVDPVPLTVREADSGQLLGRTWLSQQRGSPVSVSVSVPALSLGQELVAEVERLSDAQLVLRGEGLRWFAPECGLR